MSVVWLHRASTVTRKVIKVQRKILRGNKVIKQFPIAGVGVNQPPHTTHWWQVAAYKIKTLYTSASRTIYSQIVGTVCIYPSIISYIRLADSVRMLPRYDKIGCVIIIIIINPSWLRDFNLIIVPKLLGFNKM